MKIKMLVAASAVALAGFAPSSASANAGPIDPDALSIKMAQCVQPVIPCVQQAVGGAITTVNQAIDLAEYYVTYYSAYAQQQVNWAYRTAWYYVEESPNPDDYTDMVCNIVWGEDCGAPGVL